MFVGQASQKQKQQIKALEDFRSNRVNVLISTSIGEEGLDVGEVDLIVCFDVSQHSPIRMVQRMGRTGRKRDGHIIVLVTDGKEHENLKSTLARRDSLNNKILNTSNIFSSLYDNNPRMIPNQFNPECHKIHIIAQPKTPGIKGKKKKQNVNKKKEASCTKQKGNSSKTGNSCQSLMKKFFTDSKCNEQNRANTFNILTQLTMQNNKHNIINPNNVKLLTDDNAGIDFLTLCAVKKSEEEMSEIVPKMDTTYIPALKPIENLFSFVVPDVEVIDLSFLTEDTFTQCKDDHEDNLSLQCKHNEDENIHDNNDYINIDGNFWSTIRNERSANKGEIRFEDILDESSDSNETVVSYLNQRITDMEINKASTSDMKEDNEIITDTKTELLTDMLDLEPTIFENILNESFSSGEDDLKDKDDTALQNTKFPISSNVFVKNAREINVKHETNVKTFQNKDTKTNQNLSLSVKLAKPHEIHEFESFIDEMQDLDFNSDDDINEFFKCDSNKNKSTRNSKAEESMLSITQAIGEIVRVKKNLETSKKPSVSKEKSINEDSTGWISVNIKNEIKVGKSDTNLKTNNITLSNTHCNSAAKSRATKQDLDLLDLDSDEDFMITEYNAKKFCELESCYFRNSSKDLQCDISCMPSTSKVSEIRNDYFDNTSRNLKTKDSSDNTSKSWEPCGVSTPKNRRPKLSLKRKRTQQDLGTIDLNSFRAPDRHVSNTADKSILKSSPEAPKQIFRPNERLAEKSKRKKTRPKYTNDVRNEFIDDEVEVDSDASSDEIVVTDDDLGDFVSYTQNPQEQVDMHAHYLKTIKSPLKRPGAFHFRAPRTPDSDIEIYSQFSPRAQDSYLYDSFCVAGDAEPSLLTHNDSLDKMEKELEENRRKRLYSDKNTKCVKKKKTNILNRSVSSEDEIEQLRVQVQEDRL